MTRLYLRLYLRLSSALAPMDCFLLALAAEIAVAFLAMWAIDLGVMR